MTFPSHLSTHPVLRSLVRPRIQIVAKGQVGLQLKPRLRAHLSSVNSQTEDERVHIMGAGCMVNLFAHSLAKKPSSPPITLLWHEPALAGQWEEFGKCIELRWEKNFFDQQFAFDTEEVFAHDNGSVLVGSPIRNVIMCTTNKDTKKAISMIKHRLDEKSTVLFVQSNLSIMEEVSEQLFPNLKSRPNFLSSQFSHHLQPKTVFRTTIRRPGEVSLGFLPRGQSVDAQKDESDSTTPAEPSRYLIQQILDTPYLAGKEISTNAIMQARINSLVWKAMIYPLSALFDRQYGDLFGDAQIQSLMKLLLSETSQVLRALPELQNDGRLATRLSPESIEKRVMKVTKLGMYRKKKGVWWGGEAGEPTAMDQLNGYIVKKGEQLGIDCVHNRTLVTMVNEKRVINKGQIDEFFPSERGS